MRSTQVWIGRAWLAWAVLFVMAGTGAAPAATPGPVNLRIMVSLAPLLDFTRRIAGDTARIRLLLPPGTESHAYEPTPSDLLRLAASDLFIHVSEEMEPWVDRLAASASGKIRVLNASRGLFPPEPERGHSGGHSHEDGEDPHIWLDPIFAAAMTKNIALALAELDPANAGLYQKNAAAYTAELGVLDQDFRSALAGLPRRTLVFGERFAFRHFFARYGLEYAGPYRDCGPGAEPGAAAIIAAVGYLKEHRVRFIYREATDTPRVSRVLAEETGAEILAVDSLHHAPAGDLDYLGAMRRTMAAFARGLE